MGKYFTTLLLIILLLIPLAASAQEPTPIPIVVTVILVFPSDTPTPTPTDGPSPTPTATVTSVPNTETVESINGQDVVIRYEVTPGDAAIVGFLVMLLGLQIVGLFRRQRP